MTLPDVYRYLTYRARTPSLRQLVAAFIGFKEQPRPTVVTNEEEAAAAIDLIRRNAGGT